MKVVINTPQGSRTIGKIIREHGRVILEKKVSRAKHLFKAANAWGIQTQALELHPNISHIRIQERETGKRYELPVKRFLNLAFELDLGFGKQLFVERSKWNIEPKDSLKPRKTTKSPSAQMALL